MRHCLLLLLLLPCFNFACAQKEEPVSKEEALAVAAFIEAGIKKGDKDILNKVLNAELYGEAAAKAGGFETDRVFIKGVKESFGETKLWDRLTQAMGPDGFYGFVRQHEKNGKQHLLYRLYGEGGLNYHDYELTKIDGKVWARDIYIFLAGQTISELAGQAIASIDNDKSLTNAEAKRTMLSVGVMRKLMQGGKFEEARKHFESLPANLQKAKIYQMMYVQIASKLDNDTYATALTEYERLFGSDPTTQLILLDGYFMRSEWDKCLMVIEKTDASVSDPFLDYYRGLLYSQKGDTDRTIQYLEKVHTAFPLFLDGTLELLGNYLGNEKYAAAKKLLAEHKTTPGYDKDRVQAVIELYPGAAKALGR